MSTVQGNYAKIVIIGSTVAYLSAGMALYYIYKRYRDRQRSKNRRKLFKTSSSASLHVKKEKEGCDCKHCTGVEKISFCDSMQSCRPETDDQNDALDCNVTQRVAQNLQHENAENMKASPTPAEMITNATFVGLKVDNPNENVQNTNGKLHFSEIDCVDSQVCDVEVSSTMLQQNQRILGDDFSHSMIHTKNECINSPSISSDGEGSQDSGKGASMGLTNSTSPVNDLVGIELPPMYEFEVPQDIVGLIIGRKGATIKYFTEESGAHIVIRHHHFSDKHKICTIEGTREQINKCLRLIRYKFPPSRFPELKLTPLLPPPIVSPHSPVFDSIINLNLPEGVSCEVTLSSMVDASHFFVQQPTHPTFPSLARLDQYLLAVYSQPAGVPGLPKPIESGIICVAPVLGGWYRAQTVATFPETDEVLVRFVDYGGYSRISAADLRQIRSDFMNLPFQAIECILANIKPVDESEGWSTEANAFFEKCVHGKLSEAVLLAKEKDTLTPVVELYCSVDGKMEKISQLLVDNGYAALVDCSTESYADGLSTCNF